MAAALTRSFASQMRARGIELRQKSASAVHALGEAQEEAKQLQRALVQVRDVFITLLRACFL